MKKSLLSTRVLLVLLALFMSGQLCQLLQADNRIMIFLKNAPEDAIQGAIQDTMNDPSTGQTYILDKLAGMDQQTPSYNSIKNIKNALRSSLLQNLSGFLGIYAGYFGYSDRSGLLEFPLRHATPKVYIAITPKINMIKFKGETIAHREFIAENDNPTKLYMCELKHEAILKPGEQPPVPGAQAAPAPATPPATPDQPAATPGDAQKPAQRFYWDIQEIAVPNDKKINPLTVVILTKPKNIYVRVGQFLAAESPHLVLPEFYVMGNVDNSEALLRALDYGNYFETISIEEKKSSDTTFQKMISNI